MTQELRQLAGSCVGQEKGASEYQGGVGVAAQTLLSPGVKDVEFKPFFPHFPDLWPWKKYVPSLSLCV